MIFAVITTCRREPAMVERALKSVIAQTYKDWDLVVIDDSPSDYEFRDDVRKMIESYASQDSRIRYVAHDRNYGAQRARNNALKIANNTRGGGHYEYIAYLDDDDEWMPSKLEKQLARFNECDENTALVYCYYTINEDSGREVKQKYKPVKHEGNVYDDLLRGNFIGTQMALVRTKYLAEAGGFDEDMPKFQDWEMWLRLARHYDFACVPEQLCKWYIVGESREHITMQSPQKAMKAYDILMAKNKDGLLRDKYAYWLMLRQKMYPCLYSEDYKKFFTLWLKSITLQPLRIGYNLYILFVQLPVCLFRSQLKKHNPELFLKLKEIKIKLKGVFTY